MKDKGGTDGPRASANNSRMRSKHHRPAEQAPRYVHDDRGKKMASHSQHEARQKGGKVNNTGGGPMAAADDRDQNPAKGPR